MTTVITVQYLLKESKRFAHARKFWKWQCFPLCSTLKFDEHQVNTQSNQVEKSCFVVFCGTDRTNTPMLSTFLNECNVVNYSKACTNANLLGKTWVRLCTALSWYLSKAIDQSLRVAQFICDLGHGVVLKRLNLCDIAPARQLWNSMVFRAK